MRRTLLTIVISLPVGMAPAWAGAQPPSPPASASQGPAPAASAPQGAAPPAAQAPSPPAPAPSAADPQGFTYNPEGRRDPFVSLLSRGAINPGGPIGGVRPAGIAGLTAAEVSLRGTVQSQNGYVGILQGADNKTYIVRPGDKLFDGTVRAITQNAVVILQQVNDPLSLDKQREVRKTLRQADEAR